MRFPELNITKFITVTTVFIFFHHGGFAQSQDSILNYYIRIAMESNVTLQKKELSYQQSLAALQEAKAAFFPRVSLNSQYTTANGQNILGLDVQNDLDQLTQNLNLINQTLAQMSPEYPDLQPYQFDFNANDFLNQTQQTFFRLAVPVFNTSIIYNHQIRQNMANINDISVDIYKKELVKEVKEGYFKYLQAYEIHQVMVNSEELARENLRTTRSLLKNNKITRDQLYEAEAGVLAASQKLAIAEKDLNKAKAYFNFLLNRSYAESVEKSAYISLDINIDSLQLEDYMSLAIDNRKELEQIDVYEKINQDKIKLNKGEKWPQISVAADYGIRGNTYSFTSNDDYIQFSANLKWDIFTWNETRASIQQAEIERQKTSKDRQQLLQKIELEVINAYYELIAAEKNIHLTRQEVKRSSKAFDLVNKRYQLGQANLLEYKEAQTTYENSQIKSVVARYNFKMRKAELERVIESYDFNFESK